MNKYKEKYRVKPGLSLTSRDLYRRYCNNSLMGVSNDGQYSLDESIQDFTRMEKTQQLNSMKETFNKIEKLKNAQLRNNQRSDSQPGKSGESTSTIPVTGGDLGSKP